jgi:hypothetical protein
LSGANPVAQAWDDLGRPVMTPGSRGQDRPHPLIAMIGELDALCERLRKPIRVHHRGPVSFLERTARTARLPAPTRGFRRW